MFNWQRRVTSTVCSWRLIVCHSAFRLRMATFEALHLPIASKDSFSESRSCPVCSDTEQRCSLRDDADEKYNTDAWYEGPKHTSVRWQTAGDGS